MTKPAIDRLTLSSISGEEIGAEVSRAVREAVVRHAAAGYPVAALKDGKAVWIEPSAALELMRQQGQTLPSCLQAPGVAAEAK